MRAHPLCGPLLLLAVCAALGACGPAPPRTPARAPLSGPSATPTSGPDTPGAAQTVTLHVGETASLGAAGDSVRFDRVVEDSRCPANARCIWPGRVVVTGTLSHGGQAEPFSLGTASGLADAPASVEAGPYRLSIAGVEPYPDTPAGIPEDTYVLSLKIEAAPQVQETP